MRPARCSFCTSGPARIKWATCSCYAARQGYGLPMSIYHDRHTILRSPKQPTLEEQLAGQPPMSQVQRVMAELGIESITAYSPRLKGASSACGALARLADQDLRLAGITTWKPPMPFCRASSALNARFAKAPAAANCAWVPLPADLDIPYYFAIRETRTVRADHCIRFAGQLLQLLPAPRIPAWSPSASPCIPSRRRPLRLSGATLHRPSARGRAPPAAPRRPTHGAAPAPPDPPKRSAKQRAWLFGQH